MTCNKDDSYIHSATDERLLAAYDQIELLREQLEIWRELIESLKLELGYKEQQLQEVEQELTYTLGYKEQQLQEVEQELAYTNHELCTALMEGVCLEEAKELAKTILKSKKSVSASLAELLSAIYSSTVKLEEVEQVDRSSITRTALKSPDVNMIVTHSRKLRKRSKELSVQYQEQGFRFVGFQACLQKFQARSAEFRDKSKSCTETSNNGKKHLEKSRETFDKTNESLDDIKPLLEAANLP